MNAAILLFWRQGYGATSLAQLLDAMKIGRSSFYAAYGDKRGLYVEALNLFSTRTCNTLKQLSGQFGIAETISLFFDTTLFDVPKTRMNHGCMMINTVLELTDVDQGLSDLASQHLLEIEETFQQCFQQAISENKIDSPYSAAQLAQFIMTLNKGLRVASRQHSNADELRINIQMTLQLLGLNAQATSERKI